MQAQKENAEIEPIYEADGTVVFTTKNKQYKRLIAVIIAVYKTMLVVFIVIELIALFALLLGISAHSKALLTFFVTTAPLFLVLIFIVRWGLKRLNGPLRNPALLLSSDGLTLKAEPFLGTILWDEIAAIETGRYLSFSVVVVKLKDRAALQARLGNRGRYLRRHEMPGGGLGFPSFPFVLSSDDLVARINRYRERGL